MICLVLHYHRVCCFIFLSIFKKGRAPKNSPATFWEYRIDKKLVSVIAAYTPFGFCCWRIFYDKPISAESVREFLRMDLANWLSKHPDTVVLADNASVHKSVRAWEALNSVTNGRWATVPEYSPRFSPVERGFANMWKFLQGMEPRRIQLDPLIALHDALFEYSVEGPRGYTGKLIISLHINY